MNNNQNVQNYQDLSQYINEYNKTIDDLKKSSDSFFQIYTYIFITFITIFYFYAKSQNILFYTRGLNTIIYYFIFLCISLFALSIIFSFFIRQKYNNNFESLGTLVSTISKETCINYPDIKIPKKIDNETINPNTNSNIPLFLRDFYIVGCNKPYLNKNQNGKYYESIYILKKNLKLGFRLISIDIHTNKDNKLVVGKALNLDSVLNIINQHVTDKNYELPFILYMKLNFDSNLYYLTQDLYDSIMKSLGDNLLGLSYAYNGNNNNNSINDIPIRFTKNKIIIISNKFPTQNQNLDSLINATVSNDNQTLNLIEYNDNMSKNNIIKGKPIIDVTAFVKNNKTTITILEPINETIHMKLDDSIQLGIQFYLINMANFEIRTSNLTNFYLKNYLTFNNDSIQINNQLIALKPAYLRYFPIKEFIPKPQNKNLDFAPKNLSNYMNGFIPKEITF